MKHKHESYDRCDICNSKLRECQYCGNDIAMVGGTGSADGRKAAICKYCWDRRSVKT